MKNRPLQAGSLARTRSYIAAAERRGARAGFTAGRSDASGREAIIGIGSAHGSGKWERSRPAEFGAILWKGGLELEAITEEERRRMPHGEWAGSGLGCTVADEPRREIFEP